MGGMTTRLPPEGVAPPSLVVLLLDGVPPLLLTERGRDEEPPIAETSSGA